MTPSSPLSHSLLTNRPPTPPPAQPPAGGLNAMQPPTAQMQQNAQMTVSNQMRDEVIGEPLRMAAGLGDELSNRLIAGLPSAQEMTRARQAQQEAMYRELETLQPRQGNALDRIFYGLSQIKNTTRGQEGAALGEAARGMTAYDQYMDEMERNKAQRASQLTSGFMDAQEKRLLDARMRQQQQRARQGMEFRTLADGTVGVFDRNTGAPMGVFGPKQIRMIAELTKTLTKEAMERGQYRTLEEASQWATQEAMKRVSEMEQSVGNQTTVPATQLPPPAVATTTAPPVAPQGVEVGSAEGFELLRKMMNEASRAGDRQKFEALRQEMVKVYPNGRPQGVSSAPVAQTPVPSGVMLKKDPAAEAGRKQTAEDAAKMYSKSFDESVVAPAAAFSNTSKIMQDFNNLSQMQYALKNGKFKEFMAGETGKWAMSLLPENSDLRKGIANAQEAEKLTASMVNQILLAAKGVQTEGDAQRARSQVTSVGTDHDANRYLETYINETVRQLKLREQMGLAHKNSTGTFEGYDQAWQSSPIMKDAKGSVKKLGSTWVGLTQYVDKFKAKNPGATDQDAVASWNRMK